MRIKLLEPQQMAALEGMGVSEERFRASEKNMVRVKRIGPFHSITFSRWRIGFRSRLLGFVWYPGRKPRTMYAWLWMLGRR